MKKQIASLYDLFLISDSKSIGGTLPMDDFYYSMFYLEECAKSNWSTRQLERQINSFFYQRLLSSQDQESVRNEIQTLEKGINAKDIIRDPYVLEFLGLEQTPNLYINYICHLKKS